MGGSRSRGRRGVVPGAPTGSTPGEGFQGGGRSAASSVGRSEPDSRRGVLLRGVGSGAVSGMSGTIYVVTEPLGKGGGTGAAGEKGSGGGGRGQRSGAVTAPNLETGRKKEEAKGEGTGGVSYVKEEAKRIRIAPSRACRVRGP